MNPELHHKWNDVRDRTRGSDKEGEETIKENQQKALYSLTSLTEVT